ncbi:MAG: hypothetical protein KAW46_00715, partial [candidate division Zixibacteria bacterium]|nr:hypothetical protein [candidate division Zixibacteria bacterium]
ALLLSCSRGSKELAPAPEDIIGAHTSGVISRDGDIRVRFVHDRVDTSEVNTPLEHSPFEFEPRIDGVTLWSSRNTLEFRPSERLPAGQEYTVTVRLTEIIAPRPQPEWFRFTVTTMMQSFDIRVDGLQVVDTKDPSLQQLNGRLVTADAEYKAGVEKILTVEQEGRALNVRWRHADNQRVHIFVVDSILRGEDSSMVILAWDGSTIGVDNQGTREITVSPVNTFTVTQVRAVQEREQFVEVRFSDPLLKDQDLRGLVTIAGVRRPRFTIDGCILRVYNPNQFVGEIEVSIATGVQNSLRQKLRQAVSRQVTFQELKPQIRFIGKGVIIPGTQGLTIPIEAVNLRAVVVEATPIVEGSMPQFLQVSNLNGGRELKRVGRVVWKQTVPLDLVAGRANEWIRYGLDVRPLLENHPAGLYHLKLSFKRRHIMYPCPDAEDDWRENQLWQSNWDDPLESSNWDALEKSEGFSWREMRDHRNDPCHPGYYQGYYANRLTVSRNVLVSNIGLIAKLGTNDSVFVAATDIGSTEPLGGVDLTILDYQQIKVGRATTDGEGMATIEVSHKPFLLIARRGGQTGYLRLADGSALSVSHFDVAGETVTSGFKGFLYGERGVWRPGDSLFLTFILMEQDERLPRNHPLRFELHDSRGQLVTSSTRKLSESGFYVFKVATSPDAPTGNWTARVRLGGVSFEKKLKIETVMPNRLKINLSFGDEVESLSGKTLTGNLSAKWLHGAPARQLKSDIEVTFTSSRTRFDDYNEYMFVDPVTRFSPESHMLFEGTLDDEGVTAFSSEVNVAKTAPGMLNANFRTRVFEPGGTFSVDYFGLPYHPFDQYVGIQVPKGDRRRGTLLTDTVHTVRLVAVGTAGQPVGSGRVEVKMYKIKWRWWWHKGSDSPADYLGRTGYEPIKVDTVQIERGQAVWQFSVDYPDWGRFLIRARDLDGGHQTGKIVYIDWPGWAGRARKDTPGAANVLTFSSDKSSYTVGETIVLTVPTGQAGRALVSIESGSRIIRADWIEASEEESRFEFTATEAMAPNVYAHVTFVQPHLQAGNDLPIRMYGVIPISVVDPRTQLAPRITAPDVLAPSDTAEFAVSEANGRPMTYTVAIVDEGLLDLTRFQTPDPWSHFYKREALGVKTWDLYDLVVGAFGGKLEQLLAIGGGESAFAANGGRKAIRFTPMVRFLGPFVLKKGGTRTHRVDIPQYVGSVRMMVVAGQDGAFGFTEETRPVRRPLMILGTLPRVLGTNETVDLPISVFALEPSVKDVTLSVETSGALDIEGESTKRVTFAAIGDQTITFKLKAGSEPGIASVVMRARGGGETAEQRIEIDVRAPGFPVVEVINQIVDPGESWTQRIACPGAPGTNEVMLEVSRVPPLNLGKRLRYLIRYPHGCVEQITSAVFPQLYLSSLLELSSSQEDAIQRNIRAAIRKLPRFQTSTGGFGFWRGAYSPDDWCSSYAGHFLLAASQAGYTLPTGVLEQWTKYQRKTALSWVRGHYRSELTQAYRLYTLALAGEAELGAMNRLKEELSLPAAARWRLAAAYQLAGQPEVAEELVRDCSVTFEDYRELTGTYGSTLRDKAMVLETLCLLKQLDRAAPLVLDMSEELCADKYLSTQTTAYALIAMARHAGITNTGDDWGFQFSWNDGPDSVVAGSAPMVQIPLDIGSDTTGVVTLTNSLRRPLYSRLILEGTPPAGRERAAENGLKISVEYKSGDWTARGAPTLDQGFDFTAEITVTNTGRVGRY